METKHDPAIYGAQADLIKRLLDEIRTVKWMDNHGEVPEGVRMFETRGEAFRAGLNTWLTTVRDVARDAAWVDARDASRVAARDAARGTAWSAAWESAWAGAWDAALDSAGDAALLATIYICDGLPLDPKHIAHAKLRWSVWQAGYGVCCDVDGELYCYRRVA